MKRSEMIGLIIKELKRQYKYHNYYEQAKAMLGIIEEAGMIAPDDPEGFLNPGVWTHEDS